VKLGRVTPIVVVRIWGFGKDPKTGQKEGLRLYTAQGKNEPRVGHLYLREKMNSGASKGHKFEGNRLN
jgi:hypothetical protein